MMRPILIFVAILLLIFGIVSWVTPLPGGTLALAAGMALLICTSERAAHFVMRCRVRFVRFNSVMSWIENKVPEKLSDALRRTRPPATDKLDA